MKPENLSVCIGPLPTKRQDVCGVAYIKVTLEVTSEITQIF